MPEVQNFKMYLQKKNVFFKKMYPLRAFTLCFFSPGGACLTAVAAGHDTVKPNWHTQNSLLNLHPVPNRHQRPSLQRTEHSICFPLTSFRLKHIGPASPLSPLPWLQFTRWHVNKDSVIQSKEFGDVSRSSKMRSPPESRGGGGDGGGQDGECISGENVDLPPGEEARNGSRKGDSSSKEFALTKLACNPQDARGMRLFTRLHLCLLPAFFISSFQLLFQKT